MNKVIRIGTINSIDIFCKIEFKDGRLSITGVEGPKNNGDCKGSCGQIVMHLKDQVNDIKPAKGYNKESLKLFFDYWDKWHLNDLTAGSPAQEDYLKSNPVKAIYPESHYTKACEVLTSAGLQPDRSYIHKGKPYSYGSAWLFTEVPEYVIDFLESLPCTDKEPSWV